MNPADKTTLLFFGAWAVILVGLTLSGRLTEAWQFVLFVFVLSVLAGAS